MNTKFLAAAIIFFLWGALLSFNIVSDTDLREDTAGWLFLGLSCVAASWLPWMNRP